jgi:cystathionine beta-synthase
MQGAKDSILDTIGSTPIVRLNRIGKDLPCHLFVKLEYFNPGLSIKDRIGWVMIEEAERRGQLQPGGTIIESTSGNTGIGLALAAICKGYRAVFVLPDKVSDEKVANLRAFGARVITCPTAVEPDDPRSFYSVSRRLAQEIPNSLYTNQYDNLDNPLAHYRQTGPEIWRQTGGEVDAVVLGMGTGGTVTGLGRYLKEQKPGLKMIGVDPIGSIFHEWFKTGQVGPSHGYLIEGIGEDRMPAAIEAMKYVDDVIQVTDREAYRWTRELVRLEGIFVGTSSGAAIAGALEYGRTARPGENVLVILPDCGVKYLSKAWNEDWLRQNGLVDSRLVGTVGDILAWKGREVLTADRRATVNEVARLMRERGISQLPVVEGDEPVGLVTESDLLGALCGGEASPDEAIDKLVSSSFGLLDADDSLDTLMATLPRVELVVVRDGGRVAGVLTKIDLLTHLTEHLPA